MPNNEKIRILHTSDLHLGAKLGWLGGKTEEHRKQLLNTFRAICDRAIDENVNVFLVAGDLFDSPYPSLSTIEFVKVNLDRLTAKEIHVFILPGNHDYLAPNSVYLSSHFQANKNQYLHVFTDPELEKFELEDLDLIVYGKGTDKQFESESVVKKIIEAHRDNREKLAIGLVHGSIVRGNESINNPIFPHEISASHLNYLALGDWHGILDVSAGTTKAWYSGSPELIAKDQTNAGNVLLVEIDENGTSVNILRIGKLNIQTIEMQIDKFEGENNATLVLGEILRNPNLSEVRIVNLVGFRNINQKFNIEEWLSLYASQFAYLEINDNTNLKFDQETIDQYGENTVVGEFIKAVTSELSTEADPNRKRILEEVLQEGLMRLIT